MVAPRFAIKECRQTKGATIMEYQGGCTISFDEWFQSHKDFNDNYCNCEAGCQAEVDTATKQNDTR